MLRKSKSRVSRGPALAAEGIMSAIADSLQTISARIGSAARMGRNGVLIAVSKGHSAAVIREAFAAGQRRFGESYLQEALPKIQALHDLPIEWHFIGPVQSNKTGGIAALFDWVHSVDRDKIAERLNAARPLECAPLNVCVQVNLSAEVGKSGVAPDQAAALLRKVASLPRLKLRGLMAIGQAGLSETAQRQQFRSLRELFDRLNRQGLQLDTLCMGMSDDFEAAIAEGASMVRIGSAIFGPRRKTVNGE